MTTPEVLLEEYKFFEGEDISNVSQKVNQWRKQNKDREVIREHLSTVPSKKTYPGTPEITFVIVHIPRD